MARKSRKHPVLMETAQPSRDTVGYIRLSVRDNDSSGSIENQKLIIEKWGHQNQTLSPLLRYGKSLSWRLTEWALLLSHGI